MEKYARTDNIHRFYSAKDIKDRFPNIKSIMYTKRHNESTNNQSTITKNVDEKANMPGWTIFIARIALKML